MRANFVRLASRLADASNVVSILILVVWLSLSGSVHGQVLYGSLVGTVADPTQGAVAGTPVRVVNQGTNLARELQTDDAGYYAFNNLPPGTYTVTALKTGFKEAVTREVTISQGGTARLDVVLEVGTVAEKVQVNASAASLQTESAEVRSEIPKQSLVELPLAPGRNYESLLGTIPGFTPPTSQKSLGSAPSRSTNFFVNGTYSMTKNTRIDGASQTNIWLPDSTAYVPSLEAIETVNVATNSFDGETGMAGGVAINVLIKSGTNQIRGSAFEFHNDTALKARPVLLPANLEKPKNLVNQFGGTFGGPIVRDKLFYFGSFERIVSRTNGTTFATVPTPAMLRGDMSASPTLIYDPKTGTPDGRNRLPFPGNQVPQSDWDPIVRKILPLIPAPNVPGGALAQNYFAVAPFNLTRTIGDGKINWNPTNKLSVSGRVGVLNFDGVDTEIFGPLGGPPIVRNPEGDPGVAFGSTVNVTSGLNYVVTPRIVIDASFGWTRMQSTGQTAQQGENVGQNLGIPGTNGTRPFEGGWPRFIVGWTGIQTSDFSAFGTCCPFMPFIRDDRQWNLVGNAGMIRGRHNLRFGGEFVRQSLNNQQAEFPNVAFHGPQGGFGFTGGTTALNGGAAPNLFNSAATFLLGLSSFTGRNLQVPDVLTTRTSFLGFYVQDKWQVSPKLSLSMGLRWEYYPFPTRADRGLERYDFATNRMSVCGVGNIPRDCGVSVSARQFAPRLGIAYRVTQSLVIRAGYGFSWDPFAFARQLRTNYPTLVALNLQAPNAFSWATRVVDGIPNIPVPSLGDGTVPMPPNVALTTAPGEFRRGYIQSWNFTIQKMFGNSTTLQAGYVATRQVKALGVRDYNAGFVPGAGTAGQPLFARFGRTAITNVVQDIGNSHYDALQVTAMRRFAEGVSVNLAYTWSKVIGICCNASGAGGRAIMAPDFNHLNRSVLSFNIPHYLAITSIAELPFGKNKPLLRDNRFVGIVLGGWSVNTNFYAVSGLPFNVTASNASLNAPNNVQRANQVKPKVRILGGTGPGQSYFDPLAFAPVTTPTFGTAGFMILRGPRAINIDLGLTRRFRLTERFGLEFRADAFNATNTPHWGNPGANVSTMSLNPDGTVRSLGGFSAITSTRANSRENIDERMLRLGLRLSF